MKPHPNIAQLTNLENLMPSPFPCVLTIAGSDCSGGAGIQADIKAISATGAYAAAVVTALTAQNTLGVHGIYPVAANFVAAQMDAVFTDLTVHAVKIGMVNSVEVIEVIANALQTFRPRWVILDPVMVAKHGDELLADACLTALREKLFPLATLITPNIPEAEKILGQSISTQDRQAAATLALGELTHTNVLIKGGHLTGDLVADCLYTHTEKNLQWFTSPRIFSPHTHGTGCSLSAAIAAYLAQQYSLEQAIAAAKEYVTQAIAAGKDMQIGQGIGPLQHFF